MAEKITFLWPEIIMMIGAITCMLMGLSANVAVRRSTLAVAIASLGIAMAAVFVTIDPNFVSTQRLASLSHLSTYVKLAVLVIGGLLLMLAAAVPESLQATRDSEPASGKPFDPTHALRGEFYAFFLFSLTGVMLCAGASDLVWLFLALELTSLPTYVMIAISRDRLAAQESAVKYFYLGALAVAVFLYGFALMYGATGCTDFEGIRVYVETTLAAGKSLPALLILGVVLSIVGIGFKIAAAPMQFYAADVYEGAATPVTAFLAFVPKTAGMVSLILVVGLVTGPGVALPPAVTYLLWIMAAVTMTYGNVMGLMQTNVKRMLAYSSIAHSGYMLVGLLAGRGTASGDMAMANGHAGVLFYLVAYGMGNLGAFAVLTCLQARGEEAQNVEDLSGLSRRNPILAAVLLVSMLSLVGLPPMVGFVGKIYLFGPAVHEYTLLVVIAVLNSAISAVYYLRVVSAAYFSEPAKDTQMADTFERRMAAAISAFAAIAIGLGAGILVDFAKSATAPTTQSRALIAPPPPVPAPVATPTATPAGTSAARP